jgi:NADH-quinone oxidoreductase subunit A
MLRRSREIVTFLGAGRMNAEKIPDFWQYVALLIQIVVAFGMGAAMVGASWFIGRHRNSTVKLSAYECGITPVGDARQRFSVRFYMVAMLFILFDVEAVFMMPWAVIYKQLPKITGSNLFGFWEMLVYLGFVVVGLYYIVRKGILDWSLDKADL